MAGNYAVGGNAATFPPALLSAGAGIYSVSGNPATFATRFLSSAGVYAVTGDATAFGASLSSAVGSFVIAGDDSSFSRDFEAWFPRPFDNSSWTAGRVQSEPWAAKTMKIRDVDR